MQRNKIIKEFFEKQPPEKWHIKVKRKFRLKRLHYKLEIKHLLSKIICYFKGHNWSPYYVNSNFEHGYTSTCKRCFLNRQSRYGDMLYFRNKTEFEKEYKRVYIDKFNLKSVMKNLDKETQEIIDKNFWEWIGK